MLTWLVAALVVAPFAFPAAMGAVDVEADGDAAPPATPGNADLERLALDLTDARDDTVVIPAHLPLPEMGDGIGPGSTLIISRDGRTSGCTANFVWQDGPKLYLGSAGHCFVPDGYAATHGPGADFDASGVSVRACLNTCFSGGLTKHVIRGPTVALGDVVYARQVNSDGLGPGNDFGLVEIPEYLYEHVRTHLPMWGGPVTYDDVSFGEPVLHYGSGVGYGEIFPGQGRGGAGWHTSSDAGYWWAFVSVTFGDSGSALVTGVADDGVHGHGAAGVVTHTLVGVAGVGTTTSRAIEMAQEANLDIDVVMAT